MKTLFPQVLVSLIVLLVLLVLISEERTAPSVSGLWIDGEAASAHGEGLMQALLLWHQRQSETANITEAQQLLKENDFYPGPVDGEMGQRTREALRSFQQSRELNVTGRINNATAQQLGLPMKPRWTGLASWMHPA